MVNVTTTVQTPSQRAKARMQRLRDLHTQPGVRVVPAADPTGRKQWTEEDIRRLLKHPRAGGFRAQGSIEWPNDGFTQKRLREGSIAEEKSEEKTEKPKASAHHHRGGDA